MSVGIAYQNKDIFSKVITDRIRDISLRVYGLDLPKIAESLPTDLPEIEASEAMPDQAYRLEDGSIAIIDYESAYKRDSKMKYITYYTRFLKRYGLKTRIRMVVIYTADVTPEQVEVEYQNESMKFWITPAYLSQVNSGEIKDRIAGKIGRNEPLTEAEKMELMILPMTYRGRDTKQEQIRECIELAKRISDEDTAVFVLSGIIVFGDKVSDAETVEKAKEWLRMTKLAKAYEEEKERAVAEAVAEVEKAKERALAEVEKAKEREKAGAVAETEAQKTVNHVEGAAKGFHVSVEEACEKMGIPEGVYEQAKKLLSRATAAAL